MVHAELQDYGDFGLSDLQEDERGEDAHEDPTNPVDEVEEETSFKCIDLIHNLLVISLITTCRMDCDIFIIKFMQLWSNNGLSHTIVNVLYNDKVMKYREKLLTQLIMSPKNEVKENVYWSMDQ
ncbi:hypothetical protein AAG906_016683 [Vitis piasezkii]